MESGRVVDEGWWRARRIDIAIFLGLYVAAVLARLPIWHSALYGDEGHAFLAGRTFGGMISNIHYLDSADGATLGPLFWYRPLTHLPLAIGSHISFEAWRLNHLLLTSLAPSIMFGILRSLKVRRWLAVGAGIPFAFNPIFVTFGVVVFHDALGIVALGLALWAHVRGRFVLAAIGFVAAAWVEEVALFALPFLLFLDLSRSMRAKESSLWPLTLTRKQTAYVVALALSPAMLFLSILMGAPFPGHPDPSLFLTMVDHMLYLSWLLPLILLGLRWPRSREMAGLALVFPVFYVLYYATGHAVQIWWVLLPAFLSVLGAACALDTWIDHTARSSIKPRTARTWAPRAVAAVLGALVLVQVVVPSSAAWKGEAVMPLSGDSEWNLAQAIAYQHTRDLALPAAVDHLDASQRQRLTLVDVDWFFVFTPFSQVASSVRYGFTGASTDLAEWSRAMEWSTAMVVKKGDTPLNHAIQDTYHDCQVYENAEYVIVDTPHCPPRRAQLEANYAARLAAGDSVF
ncbi:MAG TPA: hypothetical protein VM286_07985 [Candidatus Thermoplasmatota archaeon]|nr:hypothetical protein [Candidatus Thermoplasmatota archaeon]